MYPTFNAASDGVWVDRRIDPTTDLRVGDIVHGARCTLPHSLGHLRCTSEQLLTRVVGLLVCGHSAQHEAQTTVC
jgi:hypothetical protein